MRGVLLILLLLLVGCSVDRSVVTTTTNIEPTTSIQQSTTIASLETTTTITPVLNQEGEVENISSLKTYTYFPTRNFSIEELEEYVISLPNYYSSKNSNDSYNYTSLERVFPFQDFNVSTFDYSFSSISSDDKIRFSGRNYNWLIIQPKQHFIDLNDFYHYIDVDNSDLFHLYLANVNNYFDNNSEFISSFEEVNDLGIYYFDGNNKKINYNYLNYLESTPVLYWSVRQDSFNFEGYTIQETTYESYYINTNLPVWENYFVVYSIPCTNETMIFWRPQGVTGVSKSKIDRLNELTYHEQKRSSNLEYVSKIMQFCGIEPSQSQVVVPIKFSENKLGQNTLVYNAKILKNNSKFIVNNLSYTDQVYYNVSLIVPEGIITSESVDLKIFFYGAQDKSLTIPLKEINDTLFSAVGNFSLHFYCNNNSIILIPIVHSGVYYYSLPKLNSSLVSANPLSENNYCATIISDDSLDSSSGSSSEGGSSQVSSEPLRSPQSVSVSLTLSSGDSENVALSSGNVLVEVLGVNTQSSVPQATIMINGVSKQVFALNSYSFGNIQVYVNEISAYTIPAASGFIKITVSG